jgi:hypothetical protein
MGVMSRIVLAALLLCLSSASLAEKFAIGSMALKACEKGQQRATLFLEISAPNFARVQHELRQCAAFGVRAATLPGLLKKLPGAEPRFWEEFLVCTRYTEWSDADLTIETSCRQ